MDSSVPSTGSPYGWPGQTSRASARDATVAGSSSERLIPAFTSATFRRTSASGNAGVRSASASRSSPSPRSFLSTRRDTLRLSRPAPASRLPPPNSIPESSWGPGGGAAPPPPRGGPRPAPGGPRGAPRQEEHDPVGRPPGGGGGGGRRGRGEGQ